MPQPSTTTPSRRRPIKPDRAGHEERVDLALRLIASGLHDGRIKRLIAAQYDCSPRTVERYLRRARQIIFERRNRTKGELQAESMAFYERILADSKSSNREKLLARRRIDQLLGLEEPKRHELSGPNGGPIQSQVSARDQAAAIMSDPEAMELAISLSERLPTEAEGEADDAARD